MISAVIRCDGHAGKLIKTLAALIPDAASGSIMDVAIICERPGDIVEALADQTGARLVPSVQRALEGARSPWILSLEAGTSLVAGWDEEARHFIETSGTSGKVVALFRQRSDRRGFGARLADRATGLAMRVSGRLDHSRAFLTRRDVLKADDARKRVSASRSVQLDAVALKTSAT